MATRNTTTSAARNAVFNTYELFENVLLCLPEEEIINVRQVNKHWNAFITTSPRIQRKLFLLAAPIHTRWIFDGEPDGVKGVQKDDHGAWKQLPDLRHTVPAQLNPVLFATQPQQFRASLAKRVHKCEPLSLRARPRLDRKDGKSLHGRMFVSQPPSTLAVFEFHYEKLQQSGKSSSLLHNARSVRVRVENADGVRLGDLLEAFQREVGKSGYSIQIKFSTVWISGVVFPTAEEGALVEKGAI